MARTIAVGTCPGSRAAAAARSAAATVLPSEARSKSSVSPSPPVEQAFLAEAQRVKPAQVPSEARKWSKGVGAAPSPPCSRD
jgi:hypothetical protein